MSMMNGHQPADRYQEHNQRNRKRHDCCVDNRRKCRDRRERWLSIGNVLERAGKECRRSYRQARDDQGSDVAVNDATDRSVQRNTPEQ